MNEKALKEQIKALTLQVITPQERGTGVLIQYKGYPALLTVYHTIYGKGTMPHTADTDDIKVIFFNKAEYHAKSIEVLGELVILPLDEESFALPPSPTLNFSEVKYEQEYTIRGFPSGLDKAHYFTAKCNDDTVDKSTFKIEIQNLTSDTSGEDSIEYMKGVSGSGVFFSKDKKLYLVGLVNALANQSGTFNAVHCLNLKKLMPKSQSKKKPLAFKALWLGIPLLGVMAFFLLPKETKTVEPTPHTSSPKILKKTEIEEPITTTKKRAYLELEESSFKPLIESALAKKFSLVLDKKLADYLIESTADIKQEESQVLGETLVKSRCQLNIKIINKENQTLISSKLYEARASGFNKERSKKSCFKELISKATLK